MPKASSRVLSDVVLLVSFHFALPLPLEDQVRRIAALLLRRQHTGLLALC